MPALVERLLVLKLEATDFVPVLKFGLVAALVNSGLSGVLGFAKSVSTVWIISSGSFSTVLRDNAFKIDDKVFEHEMSSSVVKKIVKTE